MLTRSPRSRFATIVAGLSLAIAIVLTINMMMKLRSQTSHGSRRSYAIVTQTLHRGDPLGEHYSEHVMFSHDAPSDALTIDEISARSFARVDLAQGTIVTKNMLSKSQVDTSDNDERIVFIPTHEKLVPTLGSHADLIAVDPEGFGADTIATSARILFFPESDKDESGYFVSVTQEEALDIAFALTTGEVRFALTPLSD